MITVVGVEPPLKPLGYRILDGTAIVANNYSIPSQFFDEDFGFANPAPPWLERKRETRLEVNSFDAFVVSNKINDSLSAKGPRFRQQVEFYFGCPILAPCPLQRQKRLKLL